MNTLALQLYQAVAATCPVVGVAIGSPFDKTTWRIDFDPAATDAQKAGAQAALDSFDPGLALTRPTLEAAVQDHLDSVAKKAGYDSIFTAVTYADEPAVPKFQTEGRALRAWRSNVWATCYSYMADVQAGVRAVPTADALVAALPPAPVL